MLITKPQETSKFAYNNAPKRPKCLPCDIYTIKVKGIDYNVVIGLYESLPFEVFAISNGDKIEGKGFIVKASKRIYKLLDEKNEPILNNLVKEMSSDEETITRLISTSLRHGTDIKFLTQQLDKTSGSLVSFDKAISRILKKYLKKELTFDSCPECQSKLIMEEGCTKCPSCGYSRC